MGILNGFLIVLADKTFFIKKLAKCFKNLKFVTFSTSQSGCKRLQLN